jgi:multidrug efflux system outer membrane protein
MSIEDKKASSSFLKKRTKKLLRSDAETPIFVLRDPKGRKVFCFALVGLRLFSKKKAFLSPILLASLGACSLIPDYKRPALPVSSTYPTAPDAAGLTDAADLGWRDFFADPVMTDLIAFALANNRDLRVAIENVAAAQAQYRSAHASLFPTIDATASAEFERVPGGVSGFPTPEHINAYSLGLSAASYELDLFGKIRSQAAQSHEEFLSDAETRESTQISLVAQIASEYLTWLADRDSIKVSADTAKADQRAFDLREMTLAKGTGTALDVAEAESTLRTAQASEQQYTRAAAQDMDELVLLAGAPLPPDLQARMMAATGLDAQPHFPALPAGLPSDLLQRRPDIRAAEHTLLAANANIGAARAAFFPSLTLTGSGGTGSGGIAKLFGAGTASWLFEPNVSVPIFDAGANFANLDYAKIQKRIEIADYEKTIQSAFHDVADALAARTTYGSQVAFEQQLVAADSRDYNLSKMRFDAGIDSYLTVLVAQSSLFSARINLVSLKLAEQQNLITLYKALGGGWVEGGKPVRGLATRE